ncbi:MAG: hypothetical protein NZ898_15895 [Myxococcota bacterium]|nr:hypothetical protein [Myxococcota bacterium]
MSLFDRFAVADAFPTRRRGRLVALSGVDGAGKSTQLHLLAAALRAEGRRVADFWFRPGYSARLDGLRRSIRALRPQLLPRADRSETERARRERLWSRRPVRMAWLASALIDAWIELGVSVRRALRTHDDVLCDRYVLDATIDLRLKLGDEAPDALLRTLGWIAPRADVTVALTLPWDLVLERTRRKNEPFPEPEHERRRRYEAYVEAFAREPVTLVDASAPVDAVAARILECVEGRSL